MLDQDREHSKPVTQLGHLSEYPVARRRGLSWLTMLGIWTVVFLLVWTLVRPEQPSALHNPNAEPRSVTPRGDLVPDEQATIEIFREASPSVVYITSSELGRDFFGFNVFEIPRGAGSGFIFDRDGHIVTNFHVIQGGTRWTVTLADESQWEARLVGFEADKDIAVLKIDAPPERLKPITVGASNDLRVGQKVLAIGNPFGFDQTLTVGVVSALGREIESVTGRKIRGVIQTDAAINPGSSGGPLLDSAGRLIGVNTQIASPSGANAGIGFAVPVDIVNEIVPDLIRYGRVLRPGLGVVLFQDWQTRRLGIRGLLIDAVREKSGAAQAGLRGTIVDGKGYIRQLGDIIVKINNQPVRTVNELKDALEPYKVGDEVQVTFVRDDEARVVTVKLEYIN
ncbi:MAG: trypsin-like peptidase domain-containing protein [Phycisphaerae bacterium]